MNCFLSLVKAKSKGEEKEMQQKSLLNKQLRKISKSWICEAAAAVTLQNWILSNNNSGGAEISLSLQITFFLSLSHSTLTLYSAHSRLSLLLL